MTLSEDCNVEMDSKDARERNATQLVITVLDQKRNAMVPYPRIVEVKTVQAARCISF